MPRDWYLKSLDPDGKRPLAEVYRLVSDHADQYWALARAETAQGQYGLLDALDVYESFKLIQRHADWCPTPGEGFPWGCLCLQCQKWTPSFGSASQEPPRRERTPAAPRSATQPEV